MLSPSLTVSRANSFEGLEGDWKQLIARCPGNTIFLTPEWQKTWWTHCGFGELHLLAVRAAGDLVGVAPLVRIDGRWEFAGGAEVADFLDLIATAECAVETASAVLEYLLARGGPVDLRNLRPELDQGAGAFVAEARRRGVPATLDQEDVSPRVELPEDWESYLERLSKKDRHELRRKIRRLLSSGDVRCVVANDPASRAADVDDFVRLHRHSAQEKAAFMTTTMEYFFRGLVDEFAPRGLLRLYFLEIDRVRVAAVILFDYCQQFFLYNSGYDPSYSHLSVGLLLKAFCLRDAIAERRRVFDFLQGSESYKYDLGAVDVPILRLRLEPGLSNGIAGSNHRV